MNSLKLLVVFNFIIVVFNFIFIIRNFFTNYRGSEKLYINVTIIVLLIVSLIISATCVLEGKRGIDIIIALKNPDRFNLSAEKLQAYKMNLDNISTKIPINTIVSIGISIVAYLLFANIIHNKKKKLRKSEGWDFEKVRKD